MFERLTGARARTLVVSPGLTERPGCLAGNDLPGVMLSTPRSMPRQPVRGPARHPRGRDDRQRER
ncbi:hypothetical protein HBB16_15340 [Pseudonocardia sp. MCCB 268]|nr:hypothetical protein [Pseudonocardia cytotoxica]